MVSIEIDEEAVGHIQHQWCAVTCQGFKLVNMKMGADEKPTILSCKLATLEHST